MEETTNVETENLNEGTENITLEETLSVETENVTIQESITVETGNIIVEEAVSVDVENVNEETEEIVIEFIDFVKERLTDDMCCEEKLRKKHRTRRRKPRKKGNVGLDNTAAEDIDTNVGNILDICEQTKMLQLEQCGKLPICDVPSSAVFYSETIGELTKRVEVSSELQIYSKTKNAEKSNRRPKKKSSKKSCVQGELSKTGEGEKLANENVAEAVTDCRPVVDCSARATKAENQKQSCSGGGSPRKTNNKVQKFEKYLSRSEVEEGIESGTLIKGLIRINPRNYKEAFINDSDGQMDILIAGVQKRNRALEGDEVVVQLDPPSDWKLQVNGSFQKTGKVVFISARNHLTVAVGILKRMSDENSNFALFSPRDARIPRMKIPLDNCPVEFLVEPEKFKDLLIFVKMKEWNNINYALGEIVELLGEVGDLQAETTAILLENGLDVSPFPDFMKCYFPQSPYQITEEEIKERTDFRKECIFTIDPATARDLDDAMSCKLLDNGNFEVGVHISDVTYFLNAETPLDAAVSKKATTVYLVDEVYHMLPKELCLMCSLLPGEDKLTYSVIWELTPNAEVVSHRFTRSVINSCSQLAYGHVQEIIEYPDKQWTKEELPAISGGFEAKDIVLRVLWLHKLALILRKRRFDGGALKIDQTKIFFSLDETGLPLAYSCYVNNDSHRLIEEFMLLANMTVAERLHSDHPEIAFLRCHPGPISLMLNKVKTTFEKRGIHLDISSAGALQTSMWRYDGDDYISQARMMVIASLCARGMCRAKYFCSGSVSDCDDFSHYALNVPLYTHFTSPIRRYADVMVHRLLGASLGYRDRPKWTKEFVQRIATNCNNKKYAAKLAGEQSSKLFLSLYLKLHGPVEENAVVVDVKDHSFDVIVCNNGLSQRVYVDKLHADVQHELQNDISVLKIMWKPSVDVPDEVYQVIEIFSIVRVRLETPDEQFKIQAELVRPLKSEHSFSIVDNFCT